MTMDKVTEILNTIYMLSEACKAEAEKRNAEAEKKGDFSGYDDFLFGVAGALSSLRWHNDDLIVPSSVSERITIEKIGRIIKETFDAGYSEESGKVLSDTLQNIYMRIHPNAMNPAYPDLE